MTKSSDPILDLPSVEPKPDKAVLAALPALLGKRANTERLLDLFISLAATFQQHEPDIPAHLRRVATYVKVISQALKLDPDEVVLFTSASVFHDVGMGSIPAQILKKQGALDPGEVEEVQKHTQAGYNLLVGSGLPLLDQGALVALRHHEYWDGNGYPDQLQGEDIPLSARIVAVADVYDALTTRKPWKEPYPPHVARDIVDSLAGSHFDPGVVEAFNDCFDVLCALGRGLDEGSDEGWSRTGMTQVAGISRPQSFAVSARDKTRADVFKSRDYFSCPFCKLMHSRSVESCPTHKFPVRRVHKLSGHLLQEKYLLKRAAGAGGMATVYEAVHLLTQRRLAIKMLDPVMARNDEDVTRFLDEARVFATVGHPNLVEVLDVDRTSDRIPFMVMEFLEGIDLADFLEDAPQLDETSAAVVAIELLTTLASVHAKGIVHRDLKPENIFLIDDRSRLKLLDFGISLQQSEDERRRLTEDGKLVGTPEYMSPEQAMGRSDLDARSDLFSVGALLYELVAGKRAFDGPNQMAIMMAVANVRYTPLREVRPDISRVMADTIENALRESPRDRFRSALEFAAALEPLAKQSDDWRPGRLVGLEAAVRRGTR